MKETNIEDGFTLFSTKKEVIILDDNPAAFKSQMEYEGLSYDVFTSMADVISWEVENERNIYKLYCFPDNNIMYVIWEETDEF